MATLDELDALVDAPEASEAYASELEQTLDSLVDEKSVRANALKQIGRDILERVRALLTEGTKADNLVVTKNGIIYMEPGEKPIRMPSISAAHEAYVLHTTNNVVRYDDGIPDDVEDIFDSMRTL